MPEVTIERLANVCPQIAHFPASVRQSVEIGAKFDGYIARENARIAAFVELESKRIPDDFDFAKVHGLTTEVLQKLEKYRPHSLGEAQRIPGVTPAAVNAIWIMLK